MNECSLREKVNELYFVFQPIIHTVCERELTIDSYEVLLRSKRNDAFPSHVFKELVDNKSYAQLVAEQYINMVHDFMEREAHAGLSINLRYQQLLHTSTWNFLESVEEYKDRITVEFTEIKPDNYSGDNTFIVNGMQRMKAMGYQIALDDVGSGINTMQFVSEHLGYLSWIKLSLLPFQLMKRSDLLQFIRGWLELANDNQLRLVVEAVEDEELAEQLRQMGINYQQGFLWGRAGGL